MKELRNKNKKTKSAPEIVSQMIIDMHDGYDLLKFKGAMQKKTFGNHLDEGHVGKKCVTKEGNLQNFISKLYRLASDPASEKSNKIVKELFINTTHFGKACSKECQFKEALFKENFELGSFIYKYYFAKLDLIPFKNIYSGIQKIAEDLSETKIYECFEKNLDSLNNMKSKYIANGICYVGPISIDALVKDCGDSLLYELISSVLFESFCKNNEIKNLRDRVLAAIRKNNRDGGIHSVGKDIMIWKIKSSMSRGMLRWFSFMDDLRLEFETYVLLSFSNSSKGSKKKRG